MADHVDRVLVLAEIIRTTGFTSSVMGVIIRFTTGVTSKLMPISSYSSNPASESDGDAVVVVVNFIGIPVLREQ
jgi:hypothetical protein